MIELQNVLRGANIDLPGFQPNGKFHKVKAQWAIGWQNHSQISGGVFYVIVYGDFKADIHETFVNVDQKKLSKYDRELIQENMARAQEEKERAMAEMHEQASIRATKKFANLSLGTAPTPYMRLKLIDDFYGAKPDGDQLVVPMKDVDGKIWSLQTINADGKQKRFMSEGKKNGSHFVIGKLSDPIYLAEGFSTAASIHQALGAGVVVAFDCGNLKSVGQALRVKYPDRAIVICGDDDRFNPKNPGRTHADELAPLILGTVVYPKFGEADKTSTDFNDLHSVSGIGEVKAQFSAAAPPKKNWVRCLGVLQNEYFFTSSHNQQVVNFSTLDEANLVKLMPVEYWAAAYPPQKNGQIPWKQIRSDLFAKCRERGRFLIEHLRGIGVWLDHGRTVLHMGDHLLIDNERVRLGDIKSKYIYALDRPQEDLPTQPLNLTECQLIVNAAKGLKWRSPESGVMLAGGLVTMRLCGALPIRPHFWLTGERGSGKTTILQNFVFPLLGRAMLAIVGNSTEAGIRQVVQASAIPVTFDEFESKGRENEERQNAILDLFRIAWSETDSRILKGGADGVATSYRARFGGMVIGIRPVKLSDADQSRFTMLHLLPHGSNVEHWQELQRIFAQIDDGFADRFFVRAVKMLPVVLANFKVVKRVLAEYLPGARFGDQYGMILAGFGILVSDEALTEAEATEIVMSAGLVNLAEESNYLDHRALLDHLLSSRVRYGDRDMTIASLITKIATTPVPVWTDAQQLINETLLSIGIKVEVKNQRVCVIGSGAEMMKILSQTHWAKNWKDSLDRLAPQEPRSRTRFTGSNPVACTRLPFTLFGLA